MTTDGTELGELEAAVLDKLFVGNIPAFLVLRRQRQQLRVRRREFSGVGFFTEFDLPVESPKLRMKSPIRFGDVLAQIPRMLHGAGFVIFVDEGALTMLEGYSLANEPWLKRVPSFDLSYLSVQRDLSVFSE